MSFYTYSWNIDNSQEEITIIRIYCLSEDNKSVCIRVEDFTPYVYIELPTRINWSNIENKKKLINKMNEILRTNKSINNSIVYKYKLYYSNMNENKERIKFPFLFCTFNHKNDIKRLVNMTRKPLRINGIVGEIKLKIHEQDANEILQFVCRQDLPTSGWIKMKGREYVKIDKKEQITYCDEEYLCSWKNIFPDKEKTLNPKPKIMSFDIEVNSSEPNTFPNCKRPKDKVFMISCITGVDNNEENIEKCLLTLGDPKQSIVGEEVKIKRFDTEDELLVGFSNYINEINPNILVGYNIFGFDIPYMMNRANYPCMCYRDFSKMGFMIDTESQKTKIKWSSSAYGNQEFELLETEGRIFIDLLPLVKRDYKMSTYTLKAISSEFLGDSKDDLDPKGIFKCYKLGMEKNSKGNFTEKGKKAMGIVGKYAIKDSVLVYKLIDKMQTWIGLSQMATVCNVPIFYLYTKGQQIKVFSQVYKQCMYNGYVVEKDGYVVGENEKYTGAHVFDPIPGFYENVLPFDFTSLYPTTIIAHNICWSTLVKDEENIPDSECHVFEWEDHQGCIHDTSKTEKKNTMCCKRRYKFIKEPKGILPNLLIELLDARKNTRKEQKNIMKKIKELENGIIDDNINSKISELNIQWTVLEKRQLAYKVSANSAYGALGVQKGYLPFMPGAMCTTAKGRESILKVADYITKEFNGKLIYGDTDSNYICFPDLKDSKTSDLWEFAENVAKKTSELFPKPMSLEFEEKIYIKFFITKKKQYTSISCDKDGKIDNGINKKGVILARRDNAKVVRDIYEKVMYDIFNSVKEEKIKDNIVDHINKIFYRQVNYEDFVVTKSIKDSGNLIITDIKEEFSIKKNGEPRLDKYGNKKSRIVGYVGDYKINLWKNEEEKIKKFKSKGADNELEFISLSLPMQIQLSEKMKRRGKPIAIGTRIEYLLTTDGTYNYTKNTKNYKKIESFDYFKEHSDILMIDYMYYVNSIANSLDTVCNVINEEKNFVLKHFNLRMQKLKLHDELLNLFRPKIIYN